MKLESGNLDKRIIVERYTPPSDSFDKGTWTTHLTLWADVKQAKGEEKRINDEVRTVSKFNIWIREADVTTQDRIIYGSYILNIKNLITDDDYAIYIEAMDSGK